MILLHLQDAQTHGARLHEACRVVGLDPRTVQRWRAQGGGEDRRDGPRREPRNKLSLSERRRVLNVATSPEYRDLSPQQIVPVLADQGIFLASEATFYRILRASQLLAHRGRSRPASRQRPRAHVASGPNQVWSWDITYLRTTVRGSFLLLYMIVDVWSRKIVGWAVHREESSEHAAALFSAACLAESVNPRGIVLHSDNGAPMKGSTMLATLQRLGVVPSFSRPHVSDDNPYSESLFRTLKYRPDYRSCFQDPAEATSWVAGFVSWYNDSHLHSAIRFVTPGQRHRQLDRAILTRRHAVYEAARRRRPARWTGSTRNWNAVELVTLNPGKEAGLLPSAA